MRHVAIIGNGISGVTLARHLRKGDSSVRISIISSETKHFFSRTALMYIYMGHMKYEHTKPYEDHFWEKNRIELLQEHVNQIDFKQKQLKMRSGKKLKYDELVLATGSKPNKFGWPGQDLKGVQGLYSYQDLQLLEENTHPALSPKKDQRVKKAVIVGGGLIGVELAEMLLTRNIEVTFLVREGRFWGNVLTENEGPLIEHQMEHHGVDLRLNTELQEIHADELGQVKSVTTKDGKTIECEFVGLTAGVSPNIDFLKDSELETDRGIVVNTHLETNIEGVYAIGDCAQFKVPPTGRRAIEQVWYTGRMMGETLAQTLLGERTEYAPGPWFNSAKFFNLEYQTYGMVAAQQQENEKRLFWQSDDMNKALTLVYEKESHRFIGLNVFGMRLRHELMDRWLREERDLEYVLVHLRDANFDPEFYKRNELEIIMAFNRQEGQRLSPKKKSWKRIFNAG